MHDSPSRTYLRGGSDRGAMAKVRPKVEVPPHLRLGLDKDAYEKFVEEELSKVGFSQYHTSIRSQYPERLFWIAEQYGDRPTGYDLAEATKMWLRMNHAEDRSVCEVLKERGWEGVGEAEVFLSHVQAESPKETLKAMRYIDKRLGPARRGTKHRGSKILVDYFCLRQLRNDFQPNQIEELIRMTGAVFVFIDGQETGSSYPTRSFCILEFSSAVKGKAILMVKTPGAGPLAAPSYGWSPCCFDPCCSLVVGKCACCECLRGDSEGRTMPDYVIRPTIPSTASRADDKAKVDTFIEEGPGFARVNQVMQRELRRTATLYAWDDAIGCWCCPCRLMGLCFDRSFPGSAWNPCGWALPFLLLLDADLYA